MFPARAAFRTVRARREVFLRERRDRPSERYTRWSAPVPACGAGRAPEEETPPEEVRRSLKTQQHAHTPTDSSVEMCVQVRRRRSSSSVMGETNGGAKIDPVLRPEAPCV